MHHVRQENLPFVGSSHEFVGAEHGDTGVSVFIADPPFWCSSRALHNGKSHAHF
jgi:hypothetical protein